MFSGPRKITDYKTPKIVPYTGIVFAEPENSQTHRGTWEVWYKGVQFADLEDLKSAYDRLQKLISLDTTGGE
jgi:hypothetical protein